jgi:hypothetical protein
MGLGPSARVECASASGQPDMGRALQYLLLDRPRLAHRGRDHDADPAVRGHARARSLSPVRARYLPRLAAGLKAAAGDRDARRRAAVAVEGLSRRSGWPQLLALDGAVDGVDQHLGLDEFQPRPLGLVAVERRGQGFRKGAISEEPQCPFVSNCSHRPSLHFGDGNGIAAFFVLTSKKNLSNL